MSFLMVLLHMISNLLLKLNFLYILNKYLKNSQFHNFQLEIQFFNIIPRLRKILIHKFGIIIILSILYNCQFYLFLRFLCTFWLFSPNDTHHDKLNMFRGCWKFYNFRGKIFHIFLLSIKVLSRDHKINKFLCYTLNIHLYIFIIVYQSVRLISVSSFINKKLIKKLIW